MTFPRSAEMAAYGTRGGRLMGEPLCVPHLEESINMARLTALWRARGFNRETARISVAENGERGRGVAAILAVLMTLNFDYYRAFLSRDARFDGQFFVA